MIILDSLLFIATSIVMPISGHILLKNRKRNTTSKKAMYWMIYAVYGAAAVVLLLMFGSDVFRTSSVSMPPWFSVACWLLLAYIALSNTLPLVLNRFADMTRQRAFTEAYRRDEHALPVNGRERVMMGFVAFVVGISEEMIFRGFLINYMAHTWGLPLLWSLTAGAAVFGLGHFSQGLAEVVSSAVFGLVMGFLFLYSGSLLWPIILHILYDLKIVVISKMLYKEKAEA